MTTQQLDYEDDYSRHLIRIRQISIGLTDACNQHRWKDALALNNELSEIQAKLKRSLDVHDQFFSSLKAEKPATFGAFTGNLTITAADDARFEFKATTNGADKTSTQQ